jgi:uncharacterized protein (TIGR03437 family)
MTCNFRRAARLRPLSQIAALLGLAAVSVSAATTNISFTPASLTFHYQIGDPLPAAQSLQIKSTGAAFAFTASVTVTRPANANWLTLSGTSGTTPGNLRVYVNPTGLAAGVYQASIDVIAAAASNSPQSLPVVLEVGEAAARLSAVPASLATFAWTTGAGLPAAQPVTLSSSGVPLSATISASATWIKAQPGGSVTLVGLPATVQVSVDPTGLAPGHFDGKITFSSSTAVNKTATVAVGLDVKAGTPTLIQGSVWPAGIMINSEAVTVTINGTNFFSNTVAAVNGSTTGLTTTIISPNAMLVNIPKNLLTTAGSLSITASTPPPQGASWSAVTSQPVTFVVYPAGPQILAVESVASYDATAVSPGEIVTIYGVGMASAPSTFQAQGNSIATALPAASPNTTVTFDGAPAPLLYVSPSQLTCIVPYAVKAKIGATSDVVVTYNSNPSAKAAVSVAASHPAVFTLDASGVGQAAALNYNSSTNDLAVNGSKVPAAKGSTIWIYVTGYGLTSQSNTGDEAQLISGVVSPTGNLTVTVDGQAAAVQSAVAPVGSVPGVLQVTTTVPAAGIGTGNLSLHVLIDGVPSQEGVTIAVK